MPEDLPPNLTDVPTEPLADAPPTGVELSPAACAVLLAQRFPAVFAPGAPKPLKLRIQVDVQQRAPGVFTKKALSHFLHRHTTSTAYLRALMTAVYRADLDGLPAGDVAEEHRQAATAELDRRRASHEARRAAERDAQRQRLEAARRLHAADDAARSDRAALLRAFESTTLTRANFCALKAVPDAELDTRLAQARLEREQRAQAHRPAPPDGPRTETRHRPARPEQDPPRHVRRPGPGPKPAR